jgi:hypothetical protein
LQNSFDKNPIPNLPHTPIATRVDMINRSISPDSSARAPKFATPTSNEAPGIGTFAEKDAVHVFPMLLLIPKSEAHALYPKLAGIAHGKTHADAPMDMKF